MDILGIGAHPDGIELSCGGLPITAAREGQRLSPRCHRAVSGDPHEWTEESKKAAQFIGAKGLCVDDFPEGRLGATSELINRIEARIDSVNPGVILTHFAGDVRRDHRAILSAALEAERSQNIFDCEIPLTRNFEPMVYFDITDDADYDVELTDIMWSEWTRMYLKSDATKGLAEFSALQSSLDGAVDYVEAFGTEPHPEKPGITLEKRKSKPEPTHVIHG